METVTANLRVSFAMRNTKKEGKMWAWWASKEMHILDPLSSFQISLNVHLRDELTQTSFTFRRIR